MCQNYIFYEKADENALNSHKVYKKFSIFGQHDMLLYKLLSAFLLTEKKKLIKINKNKNLQLALEAIK